jgi:peptidoglycan hydrolase-like protein with peptidoglycan-binding domain
MAKQVNKKEAGTQKTAGPVRKKSNAKKIALISVGAALAGILSFFGYKMWKRSKQKKNTAAPGKSLFELKPDPPPVKTPASPPAPPVEPVRPTQPTPPKKRKGKVTVHNPIVIDEQGKPVADDSFPLKSGSKGPKVRQLQEALMEKYAANLPKGFKADGVFGKMTASTLTKSGYSSTVDESAFNVITQNVKPTEVKLAGQLYKYVIALDFGTVLKLLSAIQTPEQYSQTSKKFMNFYPLGSRPTLVTKLITTFRGKEQQELLRQSFLRMGLKYRDDKWVLSGISSSTVQAVRATHVYDPQTKRQIPVRSATVLGELMAIQNGFILLRNRNGLFVAIQKDVRII